MSSETVNPSEIFASFEGEGVYLGRPAVFVRFAGCNLSCSFCDTAYAREVSAAASVYTAGETMSLGSLAYLLWASTGIQRMERGFEYRTAPSAGALYPIETYLVINDIAGVDNGVYHYSIITHVLEEIKLGNFQFDIAKAALGQRVCMDANVNFVWTAIFERSKWKYKQRAYRYIYLDAGHIAENPALAATALDFGSCQIGAIFDDEINKIIDVDGESESAIYLSAVGRI